MEKIFAGLSFIILIAALAVSVLPAAAQVAPLGAAQCNMLGIQCSGAGDDAETLGEYLWAVVNVFLAVVAVIAVAFIVYGGVKYITSGGDQGRAEEGKKAVQYAVIGIIIVGIAAVIVNFTMSAIGVKSSVPGTADLPGVLWTIVNVFLLLVGVVALIYVVIGGVKYITSGGDEGQAEEGKKAVLNAVIGIIVVGLATVIVNFTFATIGASLPLPGSGDLVGAIWLVANAFLMVVGVIALVFMVIGGVRYVISQGDEGETEKAKRTILYALIGLIVIGLSAVIVNFVLFAV